MKQRSTTPVSKSFAVKATLVAAAILMTVSLPLAVMPNAKADKYDAQIQAIEKEIAGYKNEASKLDARANTLQQKLQGINNEKAQIQARIDLNQAKYNKLKNKIKETENDIATNRSVLGDTLANLYVDGTISPLEMLASSKNIGDYVDKQEYQSSIRDELTQTIDKIKDLKAQLDKQKKNVETVLGNQKRARSSLSKKEAEQQSLINATRGKESAYKKLSKKGEAQRQELIQQQQAAITAASGGINGVKYVGGGAGGYPWSSSNCYVDAFAMSHGGSNGNGGDGWGYGCRQCASYVAWKIGQRTGVIPTDLGDAVDFPNAYTNHYTARKNSVGVITSGGRPGHVAWVETNPDTNGDIIVSQYNANYTGASNNWGNFTRVKVPASTYNVFLYF